MGRILTKLSTFIGRDLWELFAYRSESCYDMGKERWETRGFPQNVEREGCCRMLEKLKNTFDRGIATVSVKSESMVEMSRIKAQIQNLQRQQTALTAQLGSELYEMWKAGTLDQERIEAVCGEISACEQGIMEQNRRMEQVRREEQQLLGVQPSAPQGLFCPSCGMRNPAGAKFCIGCGTKITE